MTNNSGRLSGIKDEIGKVIIGQEALVERVLVALLADGHILLEGVPGLAKTLLVKTLSNVVSASFSRLQFTPDMLPADVTGTQVYDPATGKFSVHPGPVFANFILADEINRAPSKVQSALLEAMQERQVTIADKTIPLEDPFLVLATQNPIEQEGTYPLPEAQIDRFMMKLILDYPSREQEDSIIQLMTGENVPEVRQNTSAHEILAFRKEMKNIFVDERIRRYILDLVFASRYPADYGFEDLQGMIAFGASPRASIYFVQASRALAFLRDRDYVSPNDVKHLAPDILRHRIIMTYEAEALDLTPDLIIQRILDETEIL